MTNSALSLKSVHKSFDEAHIIRGVDLELFEGERHAVIGPNGAGKSTLFHLISGQLTPCKGTIKLQGQTIQGMSPQYINRKGLGRSFQITNIFRGLSVFENVQIAVSQRRGLQFTMWKLIDRIGRIKEETDELLEHVRLTTRRDTLAGELSYSEQRALEISMTLASDPQIILFDEPMAGMSHEETDYMIALIREVTKGRSLLIVEHDMDVVFSLSDRISVLVYGKLIATGTPEDIRNDPLVQEAYLGEGVGA